MSHEVDKKSVFIHQLLPALFFKQPTAFITSFEKNGNEYSQYLWKNLAGYSSEFTNKASINIKYSNHSNHNIHISLFEFDQQFEKKDCVAIAFMYRKESNEEFGIERIFTVETTNNLLKLMTIFEWDQEIHRMIKSIQKYNQEDFLSEIIHIVTNQDIL